MSALPQPIKDVVLELEKGLKKLYGDRYRGLLLFGSYARRTAREGSDVDLLLLLEGPVNASREILATSALVGDLSLDSGFVLAVMPADFGSYQRGESMFLRVVRKEAVPIAA